MNNIITIAQYTFDILLLVLAANTLYLIVFSIAGSFNRKKALFVDPKVAPLKTLVIYPAYKEDEVIIESVRNIQKQDYPSESYQVMVIADSFREETIREIMMMGAWVYRMPASDKRNKARAINHMLSHQEGIFDVCVVMDADNHVESDFLTRINSYFHNGVKVLQARRVAKNNTNELSQLDSYSEVINNHIFRQGQRVLGFSASLIGSGMAFDYQLFKKQMNGMDVFSGFDKELELRLLESKIKIEYAPEIKVYDEKVANENVFVNQRRRWIYAQWYFLQKNTFKAIYKALSGNFDYSNKVVQFALLPRIICIGLAVILFVASAFFGPVYFALTLLVNICLVVALIIPVRDQVVNLKSFTLIGTVFTAFGQMLLAMGTAGRAAGKFLHTPHNSK